MILKKPDCQIRDYKADDFAEVNNLWIATGMGGAERGDDNDVIQKTIKADGRLIILENKITKEIIFIQVIFLRYNSHLIV